MMGTDYVKKRGSSSLNNCGFTSTKNMVLDPITPFKFLMDMSMVGVGVGFDTKGAGSLTIKEPEYVDDIAVVPDTREGWIRVMSIVLDGFFSGGKVPKFDYSEIRPAGAPIKGFGGEASGPLPLIDLVDSIKKLFINKINKKITSTDIVDIFNLIGKCVVSGNVRRSSEIAIGDFDDENFMEMKNYDKFPEENKSWRWSSNNSIFAKVGINYSKPAGLSAQNGEPGYVWLDNARRYGRMIDLPNDLDYKAAGCNPCFGGGEKLLVVKNNVEIMIPFAELSGLSHDIVTPSGVVRGEVKYSGKKSTIKIITKNVLKTRYTTETIVTPDHVFVTREGESVEAKKLMVGQKLKTYDYHTHSISDVVIDLISSHEEVDVYDFTTPGINLGIVNGCIVHNCGEQTLEPYELCCLVETFPSRHESYEEYQLTLKYSYLYAKTVTLIPTHWEKTNAVMLRNRRIGTSQSGIIDAFAIHGRSQIMKWCDSGYKYLRSLDGIYSDWLCIPRSIKITSVKPSGSVSLLPGVSPGIHYPHSQYYIRRIRVASNSKLVQIMEKSGYKVEKDVANKTSHVIEFPIHVKDYIKGKSDASIWEQAVNAVDYQKWWADNQVSITVTFKEEEKKDIENVLSVFDSSLKSISFLPLDTKPYPQMPYETITKEEYEDMISKLSKPDYSSFLEDAKGEKFCDGDSCTV